MPVQYAPDARGKCFSCAVVMPSIAAAMILERILAKRIVPVVVLDSVEHAEPLAEALLAGGLDIMEITFRTDAAEESIKRIAARFPEILLGAGTLLEKKQVKRAKKAGA
jgi:2-dehydro-3-deoxyphosphogluconate aldolase / (4S)-4-hydroxy-2-oxoglutarate aldolase